MQDELLNKNSNIPIHHQLYSYIKEKIENGDFKENTIIPSEQELQDMFHVSRITVRRAISDLSHDGYLLKKRGVGTIVLPKKRNRDLSRFESFTSNAIKKGERPSSVILECKTVQANVKVAKMLNLEIGENVYLLKRLRLINGKIIAIHNSHISSRLGLEIKPEDFDSDTSLYDFLEGHNIKLDNADETCEAKIPEPEVRRDLYIEEHEPVLYRERVTYSDKNIPVEYSENSYIAKRYKYNIHISKITDRR